MAKKIVNYTKLRDLAIKRAKGIQTPFARDYYNRIVNLLMNAFAIECTDDTINFGFVQETFVKRALIDGGLVGYDKIVNRWYYAAGEGINDLGYPKQVLFYTATGENYRRNVSYEDTADGAYIIYAMPHPYSVGDYIDGMANILGQCDASAIQNILATKTPAIFVCASDDIRLSVEQAIQQIQDGKPALVVANELADALKGIDTRTDYIADRVELYKRQRYDALLNELGVLTNIDKAERVQSAEVNAGIGECKDYISIWIDTFNRQCEVYGLPYKMRINNALEEIYPAVENIDKGIDNANLNESEVNTNDT